MLLTVCAPSSPVFDFAVLRCPSAGRTARRCMPTACVYMAGLCSLPSGVVWGSSVDTRLVRQRRARPSCVVRRFACSYFLHMELNLKRGYRAASLPVVTDTGLARTDSSAGEQKKKAVSSAGASAAQQPRAKRFEMATRHAFIAGCRDGEPCCRLRCWDRFDDVEWRAAILACQRGRTEMELTSFISNKLQALTRTKTGRFQYNLNGAPVCSVAWRSWLAVGQHKFRHAAAYIRWRRDALSDCASQSCSQVGAERGDYVSARQRRWRRGANGCVDRCCVV